jgi:hypothetical protein
MLTITSIKFEKSDKDLTLHRFRLDKNTNQLFDPKLDARYFSDLQHENDTMCVTYVFDGNEYTIKYNIIDHKLLKPIALHLHYFTFWQKKVVRSIDYASYTTAQPFPHIVLDNFFHPHVLKKVLQHFPAYDDMGGTKFHNHREKKSATGANIHEKVHPFIMEVLKSLNSPFMVNIVEKLTGIKGLLPDYTYYGGGLHQINPGGHLDVHLDFNSFNSPLLGRVDRRVNLLLYLNEKWLDEYHGHIDLYTTDKQKVKSVLPVFNRMVIFTTSSTSWHGHPTPLACPEGMSRKSIALYYYTKSRGNVDFEGHPQRDTVFLDL